MKLGILGATGPAGRALAARLAASGLHVVLGSRSAQRAEEACDGLRSKWPGRLDDLRAGTNAEAAECEVVIVATPPDVAATLVSGLADLLAGKVVISMGNSLTRSEGEFRPVPVAEGSVAQAVAAAAPQALVAGAFHHLPAKALANLDSPLHGDVMICADDQEAADVAGDLVRHMPDLRPLWAGSLALAGPVESFTAVLLGLNIRYRTLAALAVTGVDETRGSTRQ